MDPNEAYTTCLEQSQQIIANADSQDEISEDQAICLAEAFINLNEWIKKGGFLPKEWESAKAD